jgi:PAS domain S-box-containing protein
MSTRVLLALPARTLVPLLLTVGALILVSADYSLQVRDYRRLVEDTEKLSLTEHLGAVQHALDQQIDQGNLLSLRRIVAELALHPHLTHAYLIRPGGRIVGALSRADSDQRLSDVVASDAQAANLLEEANRSFERSLNIAVDRRREALVGVMSLSAGRMLLVRSDLTLPLAQRLHDERTVLWRNAGVILLSALALSLFLHLAWFRRAARVTAAVRALGEGNLGVRVNLRGHDELAEIGAAFNDMARRLQAQHDVLRANDVRFRAMFDHASVGVARVDTLRGVIVEPNRKCGGITGYSDAEMRGREFVTLLHPDDVAAHVRQLETLRRGDVREFSMETRVLHKDGRVVWTMLSVSPVWPVGEAPDFHLVVIQDITARHEAEHSLELERNRLLAAERIGRLGSWEFYPALGRGWWSAQMFEFFGLDPAGSVPDPKTYIGCIHPDDRSRVRDLMARMSEARLEPESGIYRTDPARGPMRYLQPSMQTVHDASGRLLKYTGTVLDVTHVAEAERALRASEERLRATLEQAPNVAVQWCDRNARVLYWNRASMQLYGWSVDEAIGRDIDRLMQASETPTLFSGLIADTANSGRGSGPVEYRIRHRNGEHRYVEASVFSIPGDEGRPIFVFMAVDVTARRTAERTVEEERTHLRTLFAALPDMVWLKSPDGRFLSCNGMVERALGTREADMMGKTDYDYFPREQADVYREHDAQAVRENRSVVVEEPLLRADGSVRMVLQSIKTPVRNAAGEIIGVLGIARDITELRAAQDSMRSLNNELEQRVAERTEALSSAMKELESFSYAVSHDLKAPLRGIDGYSRILIEDYGSVLDETGHRFLANIRNGATQMHALIEDLLAYSRMERRSVEASRVNLDEVMAGVCARRADEIAAAGARLVGAFPSVTVKADRQGVELVLRNLLDNALKFSRESNPPVITLEAHGDGQQIVVSIRDNGIGFDMKYHERIFEIFQRLHRNEEFSGTGVGLALVRKAMQRMGGRVWAESASGQGACFYLEFPA